MVPEENDEIVDLFAGPRGWSEGLRLLGLSDVGVELDSWACATSEAAGHRTICADVESYPTDSFRGARGLIASPPCQAFSNAGQGAGLGELEALAEAAAVGQLRPDLPEKVRLVLEPTRWVRDLQPRWIALEQVRNVLPIWEAYATWLRTLGYSTWTGILCAADYGVPQTRRRAFLIASLDRRVDRPEETHDRDPMRSLLTMHLQPWVSMEDALEWDGLLDRRQQARGVPARMIPTDEPAPTLTGVAGAMGQWILRTGQNRHGVPGCPNERPSDQPAPTLTSRGDTWRVVREAEARPITLPEALTIQSFRPDYPVAGVTKRDLFLQVGNAVPPRLAAHVAAEASGCPLLA